MKDEAHSILLRVLKDHREQALSSRACCFGLLKDYGGNEHPEVVILADCVEHRIASRLAEAAGRSLSRELLEAMASDLQTKAFYSIENCGWAVESWAIGLNVKLQPVAKKTAAARAPAGAKPVPPPLPVAPPPLPVSSKSAEISFDYLQGDRDAYERYCASLSTEADRQRRVLHFIAAMIGVVVAVVGPFHWWSRILAVAITWAALFWGVTAMLRWGEWYVARTSAKRPHKRTVLDRYTIKVSADGIFEKTSRKSEHCPWEEMNSLQVVGKQVFIIGPTNFYVIPLRAFKNDKSKGLDFISLAKTYFDASRGELDTVGTTTRRRKAATSKGPGSGRKQRARKK